MARELGLNPGKLGEIDNHRQRPWKAPLPVFIEDLYLKRFGKLKPDHVWSIEEIAVDATGQEAGEEGRESGGYGCWRVKTGGRAKYLHTSDPGRMAMPWRHECYD